MGWETIHGCVLANIPIVVRTTHVSSRCSFTWLLKTWGHLQIVTIDLLLNWCPLHGWWSTTMQIPLVCGAPVPGNILINMVCMNMFWHAYRSLYYNTRYPHYIYMNTCTVYHYFGTHIHIYIYTYYTYYIYIGIFFTYEYVYQNSYLSVYI